MYMLDTNILIFCMRHPDTKCAAKVAAHLGEDICISVITYAELEYGIQNSSKQEQSRQAVNRILAGIRIVDFDMRAAFHFGAILAELKKKGKYSNNQDRDKMIGAHARSRNYTLVTDNTKDFADIDGLLIENWREAGDLQAPVRNDDH